MIPNDKPDGDFPMVYIGELNLTCYACFSIQAQDPSKYQSLRFADNSKNPQFF